MQQYGSSFNRDGISPWVFMPDSVENRFEVVLLPWQSSNIQRKNGRCHRDYHRADQGVQGSAFSASPGSECCRSPVCHWPFLPGPLQQNAVKIVKRCSKLCKFQWLTQQFFHLFFPFTDLPFRIAMDSHFGSSQSSPILRFFQRTWWYCAGSSKTRATRPSPTGVLRSAGFGSLMTLPPTIPGPSHPSIMIHYDPMKWHAKIWRNIDPMTIPWSKTKAEWNLLKFVEICQEHVLKKCHEKWCSSVPPANSTMLQHVAPSSSSNSVISWFWDHGGSKTNGKMIKDDQSLRISVQSSKYLNILQLSAICKVTTVSQKLKMWSLIAPFPRIVDKWLLPGRTWHLGKASTWIPATLHMSIWIGVWKVQEWSAITNYCSLKGRVRD